MTPSIIAAHRQARLACSAGEVGPKELMPMTPTGSNLPYQTVIPSRSYREEGRPLICLLPGYERRDGGLAAHVREWAQHNDAIVMQMHPHSITWDVLCGGYGPDIAKFDLALYGLLISQEIDLSRVALVGFSDGASYALSVGMSNGDLFTHVLAFSPGFVKSQVRHGHPQMFVAHGVADPVLPVTCSRGITEQLAQDGYEVSYCEFAGKHTVPAEIASQGLQILLAQPS